MQMSSSRRTVVRFEDCTFEPLPMFGGVEGTLKWRNVSFDETTGCGSYLLIMAPGASSIPHRHAGREEFFVVEGELVDFDGQIYRAGDFVSLQAGTVHTSLTTNGCKLLVTAWGHTQPVTIDELEPL